jgi:hypothetical protein
MTGSTTDTADVDARRNQRRAERLGEPTVTEMVAMDTIVPLAQRVIALFGHGRRVTKAARFVYDDGTDSGLELKAGLLPAASPHLDIRSDKTVSFHVQLGASSLDGFGFSAFPSDMENSAELWGRYHQGPAGRRNMTQVTLTGGLPGNGHGSNDQLIVRHWNSYGVCREITIVFDGGTGPCRLAPLRMQLDDFMTGLRDMQPWDIRAMLENIQNELHEHLAHTPTDGELVLRMIQAYGDQREAVAGAQAVAGPQEVQHHTDDADRILNHIRARVTGGDAMVCTVCGGTDQVHPDQDGTLACQPCHDVRLPDDDPAGG